MPLKVRATLVEMWNRVTNLVKDDNAHVYWNGEDNLYPNEIESVINNSPTAFRAASLFSKFIGGAGVEDAEGNVIPYSKLPLVNKKKGYKITDIVRLASQNIGHQYGVWFHVGYGINDGGAIVPVSIDVLDYCKNRISKEDDELNPGKIYFKDYTAKKTGKKQKTKWFYPFNSDKNVVIAQIKADAKETGTDFDLTSAIENYRGQVFYLNLTPQFKYALSRADSVYNDCDTEYRMGLYTNTQTRSGFLGKVVVVTQGLDEEKSKEVQTDLSKWLGSENSGSLYHIDVEATDDPSKIIYTNQLKPQLDDKLFVETTSRIRKNILGAFNNIPEPLISASESSLFGPTAGLYKEMKLFSCEQVEEEQEALQEALTNIGFPTKIRPIVKVETAATSDKQADAQAQLKGSVGGVTALITLQQSVGAGTTTFDAAVQVIETIYGIDRETAIKMIGNPVKTEPETPATNV